MSEDRPAFYALAPGGWRDWWTLLHPPYTVWHLSYVALGASTEAVRLLLTRSVEDHPNRHAWDRVSIVTGIWASDVLRRQVLAWAEPPAVDTGDESLPTPA